MHFLVLLGRVALGAQRPIVVKLSRKRPVNRSVRTYMYVRRSVGRTVGLSSALWKNGGSDPAAPQPFVVICLTGTEMRHVVGLGDRSTGKGTFGVNFWGEFGARHCNQWGLYGVHVRQRRDAALFPNYFGQTCSKTLKTWTRT